MSEEQSDGIFSLEVAWEDSASVGIWVSFGTVSIFCLCLTWLAVYTRKIFDLNDAVDCIHVFAPNISKATFGQGATTATEQLTMPLGSTRCTIGWIMIFILIGFLVIILLIAAFCRSNLSRRPIMTPIPEPKKPTSSQSLTDPRAPTPADETVKDKAENSFSDYDTPVPCLACLRSEWLIFRPFIAILALIPTLDTCLQAISTI